MCFGGGSTQKKPPQPYRNDPDVQQYYTPPGVLGTDQKPVPDGKGGLKMEQANTHSEWDAWEEAHYKYQKAETKAFQKEQMEMQYEFMDQQTRMQQSQMSLQRELQAQQQSAQARLQAMQEEMQAQAIAAQKAMEEQRLAFERDADLAQRDAQRKMTTLDDKAQQQSRFQAGRDALNRKNPGNTMASKGTKALQIGLNAGEYNTSGLAIPA